jgi:uncharacterized protein (DUF433 family)
LEQGGMDKDEPRIVVDPKVLVGKPVIRGTRISVELILDLMANGWSEAEILDGYPHITRADIQACLAHARDLVAEERLFPSAA